MELTFLHFTLYSVGMLISYVGLFFYLMHTSEKKEGFWEAAIAAVGALIWPIAWAVVIFGVLATVLTSFMVMLYNEFIKR